MVAIMALAYENHPDSDMRPFNEPVDDNKRDELMVASAAGVMQMHAHFLSQRGDYMPKTGTFIRQERIPATMFSKWNFLMVPFISSTSRTSFATRSKTR